MEMEPDAAVAYANENVVTESVTERKGAIDYLLLPIGIVLGLMIGLFPLSLPVFYFILKYFIG